MILQQPQAAIGGDFLKMVFSKISQYSHENAYAEAYFVIALSW